MSFGGIVDSSPRVDTVFAERRPTSEADENLGQHATNRPRLRILPRQGLPRSFGVDRKLENLFLSVKKNEDNGQNSRYSGSPVSAENAFDVLNEILNEGKDTPETLWAQFEEVVRTSAWKTSLLQSADIKAAKMIFQELLLQICTVRSREPFRQSLPAPAKIIRIYLKHGLMEYWWDKVFWMQLGVLVNWSRDRLHNSPTGEVPAHENTNRLVGDILEVWEVFMEVHGNETNSQKFGDDPPELINCDTAVPASMTTAQRVSTGWRGLPMSADIKFRSIQAPTASVHRFLHFLPNHINDRRTIRVAGAAELTRDCIQFFAKKHLITESVSEFAQPFLDLMEHVFQGKKLYSPTAIACLGEQGIPAKAANAVCSRWGFKPPGMETKDVPKEESSPPHNPRFAHMMSEWKIGKYEHISKRIGKAVEKSNPLLLSNLWQGCQSMLVPNQPEEPALEALYRHFIIASFSLRNPRLATEVWNFMTQSGHRPNLTHWNAMLAGCVKNEDLLSLQGVWSNLKAAGFEPDAYAWTTWIGGLIRCGQWQRGLQALEELGEIWKKPPSSDASAGSSDFTSPVPSHIPINAAISACLATGKPELVPHILQWAKLQDVSLNIRTFNIMLRNLVRRHDHAAIDALLISMHDHGCAPDIITVTIVLNGLLQSPNSTFLTLSPTAQHDGILNILRKLEKLGLPATVKTYCTLLDGLLRPNDANIFAAYAVLSHMTEQKLKPSSSIYTILATHYFSLQPPDIASVDALWQRIRSEGGLRDHYFFDRMIEGYARFGETEKMLAILRNALAEGKTPSWVALTAIVRALKQAREWRLLSDLVTDVLDEQKGILRLGERGQTGKDHFWVLVNQLVEDGYIQLPDSNKPQNDRRHKTTTTEEQLTEDESNISTTNTA